MLADFDHSKDVREEKLQDKGDFNKQEQGEITEKEKEVEFYAIGITLMHLVLTFPGKPDIRNKYIQMFSESDIDDVFVKFGSYAQKHVRNKHEDFMFISYRSVLLLARKLTSKKLKDFSEIRNAID